MSTLRDQIKARSAELVQREKVRLPEADVEVQVRGLMAGEVRRTGEAKHSGAMQIALSVEDPATGKPLWNPNDGMDLLEIDGLHTVDQAAILEASNRLSGMDKLKKYLSPPTENGSSSSPTPSEEPSGS